MKKQINSGNSLKTKPFIRLACGLFIATSLALVGCQTQKDFSQKSVSDLPEELQKVAVSQFDQRTDENGSKEESVSAVKKENSGYLRRRRQIRFNRSQLPSKFQITKNQIRLHSNFKIPADHPFLEHTEELRKKIYTLTDLDEGQEIVEVYLFDSMEEYRHYLSELGDNIPKRRALFLQDEKSLAVLAFWSNQVEIDLRHEITHGYLHSVVPNIPLWVDEGLAEFFENGLSKEFWHDDHLRKLEKAYRANKWSPDLGRLEQLTDPNKMSQMDYAESWLWVHFLLKNKKEHYAIWLHHYLQHWQKPDARQSLSMLLLDQWPDVNKRFKEHFLKTVDEHKKYGVLSHFMD